MTDPKEGLKQHPLLDKLAATPSNLSAQAVATAAPQTPSVRAVTGYLAKDPQEGQWRLFLTPDFDQFLTIREEDIVGSQLLATDANPMGPNVVWIKSDANLQHTKTESRQVQAQFLNGSLFSEFNSSAMRAPAGQTISPYLWADTRLCTRIPAGDGCGSSGYCSFDPCGSHTTACPNQTVLC
jgi:hypothetical protein